MSNYNSMKKAEYLYWNVIWSILSLNVYRYFFFRSIKDMSYSISNKVLLVLLIVSVAFGIIITWKRRRNKLSIAINIIVALDIYTVIVYSNHMHKFIWGSSIIAVLLSAAYTYVIIKQRIKRPENKKKIILKRILHTILGTRTIITLCFFSLIIGLIMNSTLDGFLFPPKVNAVDPDTVEAVTLSDNINVISNLESNRWKELSPQERLDTMQTIANIEAYYLGLPHELNVRLYNLPEITLGCYNDRDHTIRINTNHLDYDDAEKVLKSVCHEAYHAFQQCLCDAYDSVKDDYKNLIIFSDARTYKKEFADYSTGYDDTLSYYYQLCEIDARKYAENCVSEYYKYIDEYLSGAQ